VIPTGARPFSASVGSEYATVLVVTSTARQRPDGMTSHDSAFRVALQLVNREEAFSSQNALRVT
jgi:hypothetical protein